jgi:Spy/CpxP family protein refolding chaperone
MSLGKWFLSAALVFASGSLLLADDAVKPAMPAAPATQPVDAKAMKPKKLVEPWNLLKTLTPDQVATISKIHGEALEQERKIRDKERDDIIALLTPQQLTELKVAEAKKTAEAKERNAEKKKEAASQPTK